MDNPHEGICSLIKNLNVNDDSIVMSRKMKDLCTAEDFQSVANDNHMLKDAFVTFNNHALDDCHFAVNLALVISAKSFDAFVENGSAVRAEMLNILQSNYKNADQLKTANMKHFYNSVTLLGEYYNRYRPEGGPIQVLGSALFDVLLKQLEMETKKAVADASHLISAELARLILTQVSMNGLIARPKHKTELDDLLFAIRKCLIDVANLSSNVKGMYLMTLDLYYSNFASIGTKLETMYAKVLADHDHRHTTAQPAAITTNVPSATVSANTYGKLKHFLGGGNGGKQEIRINKEFIGRPLKASERLKFAQQQAAAHKKSSEDEEMAQQKLFERAVTEKKIENLKICEPTDCPPISTATTPTLSNCTKSSSATAASSSATATSSHPSTATANDTTTTDNCTERTTNDQSRSEHKPLMHSKSNDDNPSTVSSKSRSTRERKGDQAYFLVKPAAVRQRLKAAEQSKQPQPQQNQQPEPAPPSSSSLSAGPTDWYEEVENSANNQISQTSPNNSSDSTSKHNGYHSSSSNPPSPNEIRRNDYMNHSFRSMRSDYSTRSMDRVGNPRYENYKGFDKRNNYNRGQYNQKNGGNYNNYSNNRNNFQRQGQNHGQGYGQNQGYRRQMSNSKEQIYSNKSGNNNNNNHNSSRGGNNGHGGGNNGNYNSNNYQSQRSYPSKSYGNRNRRQSYHDRSTTPKPYAADINGGEHFGEVWD